MLKTGQVAPTFVLPDADMEQVDLSQYVGKQKLILFFYPKDDTPGCTTEACEFTASITDFVDLDAVVLGCSPDTPASHRRFIAKHGLKLRLLSDPERTVLSAYGAYGEKKMYGKPVMGVIRSTVIVDPAGKVAAHWPTVKAAGHAAVVAAKLRELRGV